MAGVDRVDAEGLLDGLDADQAAAVTESASPLAVFAAAGSGKTTVLTRRIAYRVLTDDDVFAEHVLALTFTSQAALELKGRLRRLGIRERVVAGTFHATALRLLRERAADQGSHPPWVTSDRIRLMQEALSLVPTQGRGGTPSREEAAALLRDVDWCRARQVPWTDAALALSRAGRRLTYSPERLAAAAAAYATVKKRRGVADFDDLIERCVSALNSDELWAAGVRWRYRHLFVDETQDLNGLQHALLEAIRGKRNDICLVGDPRQAIFGFNGADPEILNSVERLYTGVTILRLQRNYRCTPQIIAAGATVLLAAGQADDSRPVAPDGPAVQIISHTDESCEATAIALLVRELAGVHRPWRTCAVLARTVAQLNEVGRCFAHLGVPTNLQGKQGGNSDLASALADAYAHRDTASLADWIKRVTSDSEPDSVLSRVADAADRFIVQGTGMNFRSWVELHSPFDDLEQADSERGRDAVDLLTFHAAKGREWPTVIIAGAEVGLVPHWSARTVAQRAEEARLLYVACTRARERLVLSWAAQRSGRTTGPSPLIADLDDDPVDFVAAPIERRPPRPAPDPVYLALVTWRRAAAKAAQVDPATICSDESLRAVAQARPSTVEAVAALTDLGPIAAARVAPRLLAALNRAV